MEQAAAQTAANAGARSGRLSRRAAHSEGGDAGWRTGGGCDGGAAPAWMDCATLDSALTMKPAALGCTSAPCDATPLRMPMALACDVGVSCVGVDTTAATAELIAATCGALGTVMAAADVIKFSIFWRRADAAAAALADGAGGAAAAAGDPPTAGGGDSVGEGAGAGADRSAATPTTSCMAVFGSPLASAACAFPPMRLAAREDVSPVKGCTVTVVTAGAVICTPSASTTSSCS